MEVGKQYIVTKASDDGSFEIGDHICVDANGSINNREAQGWMDSSDVAEAIKGMKVEIDQRWIEKRKKKLLEELAEIGTIKVGQPVARLPPYKSRRAELPHRAFQRCSLRT